MGKYRYRPGAKPRTVRFLGALREMMEIANDVTVRIFRKGIGYDVGEERVGTRTVAWKNCTAGAKDSAEGMARLRAINPAVHAGLTNAQAMVRAKKGIFGSTWVMRDGRIGRISNMAYALHESGAKSGKVVKAGRPAQLVIVK